MLPLLFVLASVGGWSTPTAEAEIEGMAKIHNWIPETAEYRDLSLGAYVDGVALMRRGDLERSVWVYVNGQWHGPFLVVDCAARVHYNGRVAQGDVVELSDSLWGILGLPLTPTRVKVRFHPPPNLVYWQ